MDDILIIWTIASTIMLFVAVYWVYTLEQRVAKIHKQYEVLITAAEESDQPTVTRLLTEVAEYETRLAQIESALSVVVGKMPMVVRGLGLVRYNAFEGVGGDQSFSLALVDEHGNGAMMSSLHGRADVRVYGKPLTQWRSSHSLSADEQRALTIARQNLSGAVPVEPSAQPE